MTTASDQGADLFEMTIAGVPTFGDKRFEVINPATGEVIAEAPECSLEQLEAAVAAARAAYPRWRRAERYRRDCLVLAAEAVRSRGAEIARLITLEQGKPLALANNEVDATINRLELAAEAEIPHKILDDSDAYRVEARRKPFGVTAAICPWNYPVSILSHKLGPALLAGNTLVIKPSPYTPLSTLLLGEALRDCMPAGVVNVISGGDEVGARLAAHPAVRKVSFTGSVEAGQSISREASDDFKRLTLELGGNDPAIVLDDAKVEDIAPGIFRSAFHNSGQLCMAIKRVYAPRRLLAPLAEALAELARNAVVGDGMDPRTDLGPVTTPPQLERVMELVEDARVRGARFLCGGRAMPGPGYFFEPTVVTDIDDRARLVREEQFGPALPVLGYDDLDDAVARANDTHFGLGASIWTSDPERGADLAGEVESGTCWINQHSRLREDAPFGGAKSSGLGYELGLGLDGFTQIQVVNVSK